jgi:hypothetical protein
MCPSTTTKAIQNNLRLDIIYSYIHLFVFLLDIYRSRATATLQHAPVLWHVPTIPLFLLLIPPPTLFEWVKVYFHDFRENSAVAFFLDLFDQFVEDPRAGNELG